MPRIFFFCMGAVGTARSGGRASEREREKEIERDREKGSVRFALNYESRASGGNNCLRGEK